MKLIIQIFLFYQMFIKKLKFKIINWNRRKVINILYKDKWNMHNSKYVAWSKMFLFKSCCLSIKYFFLLENCNNKPVNYLGNKNPAIWLQTNLSFSQKEIIKKKIIKKKISYLIWEMWLLKFL